MESSRAYLSTTALLVILSTVQVYADETKGCVYTFYIQTGSRLGAGTDSVIGATLFDASGYGVRIRDLEAWGGLMGKDYDYFERGNLDLFSGVGPCISSGSFCALNLTSDGSGSQAGWYVKYVEASMSGPHLGCSGHVFEIDQWLDASAGYQLYAFRDNCVHSSSAHPIHHSVLAIDSTSITASNSTSSSSSRFLKLII